MRRKLVTFKRLYHQNPNRGWRLWLVTRWGSGWIGYHWSPGNRRLCVNPSTDSIDWDDREPAPWWVTPLLLGLGIASWVAIVLLIRWALIAAATWHHLY